MYGHGKAFVDIKLGTSDYHQDCRVARVIVTYRPPAAGTFHNESTKPLPRPCGSPSKFNVFDNS